MPDNLFDNLDTFLIDDSGEAIIESPKTIVPKSPEDLKTPEGKPEPKKNEPFSIDSDEISSLVPEGAKEEDKVKDEPKIEEPEITDEQVISEGLKNTAQFLVDNDILDEVPEGFTGTPESFKELFYKADEKRRVEIRDEYTNNIPILKELAERWEEGVPLDQLINIKSNQIRYSNISQEKLEESEALQENLLRDYYSKTTKYSEDKIEREIKRLKDLDELKSEAVSALPELNQLEKDQENEIIETTRLQQKQIEDRHAESIKKYETAINSITEIFPGEKLTDREKKELFKSITTPVALDGNNRPLSQMAVERAKDPVNFDIKLNHFLKMTNYLTDFSKIMTLATTKASQKIEDSLESTTKKTKPGTPVDGMSGMFETLGKMYKSKTKQ